MAKGHVRAMALFVAWFLLMAAVTTDAYHYTILVGTTQTWSAPVGATNVTLTLWGGGGGGATSMYCGASGGSGAAIIGRATGSDAWGLAASSVQWNVTVGAGGAGLANNPTTTIYGGTGGNGGNTLVVATAPNGTELFRAVAYGGGGAKASGTGQTRACQGGAGGGQDSQAAGPTPGGGVPPGGVDNNPVGPSTEGAMVDDVKAGGAGAGYGFVGGDFTAPFVRGANWTSPGRSWVGGNGYSIDGCFAWGGAAGLNGNGGPGQISTPTYPAANSGSGGGSAILCIGGDLAGKHSADSPGASGGVIIEYDHPAAPSATPTRSPSRSPTPSVTPSLSPTPSAQPLSQLITLVSPISGKQLTPQEDGSVASLWVGASYKEKWTAARLASGKYTFRGFNGKYLGANPGGWVRAEATSVGSWEEWDVIINAGNQWTLKSVHGTYMGTTVAGVIYLNDNASLYWTKTTV
ncbi:Fascin-like incomplete domain containing protein [Pandoravirus quercus]|uniref:Fascin-like incomplete domain containing protein n=1 Tax=Pandoravirus quercus TaxID=2107709 RepID=A0A2U7UA26_9VIRU|nr:Fascin-like incomplete domain containing protein [Pandoravirus quercus]AVK75293.1 Fascin-like incomplete domain containing protein [Pandoravirus quercus]